MGQEGEECVVSWRWLLHRGGSQGTVLPAQRCQRSRHKQPFKDWQVAQLSPPLLRPRQQSGWQVPALDPASFPMVVFLSKLSLRKIPAEKETLSRSRREGTANGTHWGRDT